MSIEAMKQALEALQHSVPKDTKQAREQFDAIQALRTAIQQAEAKTDESVVWGWTIVDNKGRERRTRARRQYFFGSTQEAKPFGLEDVAREDREFAECAPHLVITLYTHPATGEPVWFHKHWCDDDDIFYRPDDNIPPGSVALYTHPAPGVPEDVVRDAKRYQWLRDPKNHAQIGIGQWTDDGFGWRYGTEADEIIDAAMLAASTAQKGK